MIALFRRTLNLSLLVVMAVGVAGCWESEREVPIVQKKGVYQGKEDTKLTHEQREALRHRMAYQR